jgi:predicted PurR-regulated permease PerM
VILGVVALFALLNWMGGALVSLLLGWVIATAVAPLLGRLGRLHLPRWVAAALVFSALAALLVGFLLVLAPVVTHQVGELWQKVPGACRELVDRASHTRHGVVARLARYVLPNACRFVPSMSATTLLSEGARYVDWFRGALWATLGTLALGYYWSIERRVVLRTFLFSLPPERRDPVRAFVAGAEEGVGAFVRGQVLLSVIVGVITGLAYRVIGLEKALALGVLSGVMEVIPVLGPIVALLVGLLSALAVRPELAVAVLAIAIVLRILVDYVLMPVLLGRACGVNSFLLLVVLLTMGAHAGIAGAMVAVPLAAVIQLAVNELVRDQAAPDVGSPEARSGGGVLRYQAAVLSSAVRRLARRGPRRSARPRLEREIEDEIEALAEGIALVATQLERAPGQVRR